ncbi:DUF21 domain-containing protein At2g14520 isoform X1 [Manihot esculenta]|uniref:Uncharacterized protein n=1 Tax=Manihot esculenta TaxID=3983 RepID=A0ACB7GF11_MANES|nr:DUF21 domain-containing protein At2g14520 isoform X1 [Manihot esculenta]XP_043806450.1 DUF21 domain-containing protein At2g14520 isoform X1 [Manihot esculenta]KAG8638369.1 hypothetical protein MANES_14G021600v8 [Manihot esculenta]
MKDETVLCCELEFWAYLIVCFILASFAGITSGLALGLLSFTKVDLEVLIKAGQPQHRKNAAKILSIVKNEHLVLCTLLIVKSLAIEALPLFLESILPPWAAILMSVTLVIAFGEIIPQAVCSRHGLTLGANLSPLVHFLLLFLYPIAYPISKLLDWMLGKEHSALLRRAELKTLVDLHADEAGKGGELSHHETTIISGALDLTQKSAKDAMTPISEIFSLDINSKLDMHTMGLIMSKGHSRVPIYSGSPSNLIGIILVKHLIFCHPEDETPIKHMNIRRIPRYATCISHLTVFRVHEDWPLYNILSQFQKGHSHMAFVMKRKNNVKITGTNEVGKATVLTVDTDSNSRQTEEERKETSPLCDQIASINVSPNTSPLHSTDTEFQSPTLKGVIEQGKQLDPQSKIWKQGVGDISYKDLEYPPNNLDEEVLGIITMEDVMEELLQGEILDETDEYVAVHSKIRINLLPSRTSSGSSGRVSLSDRHWKTPQPSPLSSYTPILRSPIPPHTRPPLERPILYASPAKSTVSRKP